MANKGKFIVDYKKIWNQDNTYNYIPTDIICNLKDEDILDKVKENIITKLKAAGFNLKISPVNGGESLNFESFQAGSDVESQTFKIPIKLYTRNKKIMVQGTPDCQILFMKYVKEFSAFGHSTPLKTKEVELLQPETKISEDANTAKSTSKEAEFFVLPITTQFSTSKNSSTTTKVLERSGSFLSSSRIAQISQTKEMVGRLEAEFATFKLSIERRLLETVDSQLFQDKIYSIQ